MNTRFIVAMFLALTISSGVNAQALSEAARKQQLGELCYSILNDRMPAFNREINRLWQSSLDVNPQGTQIHGVVVDARQVINNQYENFRTVYQHLMYNDPNPSVCLNITEKFISSTRKFVDSVLSIR